MPHRKPLKNIRSKEKHEIVRTFEYLRKHRDKTKETPLSTEQQYMKYD
jgi:hypothetical protein